MDEMILQWLEYIRCPALTAVFSAFSFLGESLTLTAAVMLVYWLAAGRTGEKLALIALTSLPLNVGLKHAVSRPRPYAAGVVSRVGVDNFFVSTEGLGDALSFPSGHAQASASFLTGTGAAVKRAWVWAVCALVVFLIMLSRLYLGVHYPSDVLAGFALGVAVALLWELIYARWYRFRFYALALLAALSLLPLLFACPRDMVQAAGLLSGAAVFLPFADALQRGREAVSFPRRLWRVPAGALAAGAVYALSLLFPEGEAFGLLFYFLLAGAATLGAQALFRLFRI